jgi:hypothetical protein
MLSGFIKWWTDTKKNTNGNTKSSLILTVHGEQSRVPRMTKKINIGNTHQGINEIELCIQASLASVLQA